LDAIEKVKEHLDRHGDRQNLLTMGEGRDASMEKYTFCDGGQEFVFRLEFFLFSFVIRDSFLTIFLGN
jgi:hypothetical protein